MPASGLCIPKNSHDHIRLDGLTQAVGELLQATVSAGLEITTHAAPLSDVAQVWSGGNGIGRTVLTIGRQE